VGIDAAIAAIMAVAAILAVAAIVPVSYGADWVAYIALLWGLAKLLGLQ
jgi:hypothetical protein